MASFNDKVINEFRRNNGIVGGDFEGFELLLLTTSGAKSGLERTNPLAFVRDGQSFIVFAAYAGAPTNPPWYYNLLANSSVRVEVGNNTYNVTAETMPEPKRSELYERMTAIMPAFAKYKEKTSREIPVIRLTPFPTSGRVNSSQKRQM